MACSQGDPRRAVGGSRRPDGLQQQQQPERSLGLRGDQRRAPAGAGRATRASTASKITYTVGHHVQREQRSRTRRPPTMA